jgi:hypothetical protein
MLKRYLSTILKHWMHKLKEKNEGVKNTRRGGWIVFWAVWKILLSYKNLSEFAAV